MRLPLSGFVFLLLLACAGAPLAQEMASTSLALGRTTELPRRAPGVWLITTISPDIGMQRNEVCIGEDDSVIGPQSRDCAPPSVSRADDQVIVTIECGVGARREVESLLFTGDFRTWYRAQSRITSGASRSGYTIDAKFLKPGCAPG